MSVWSDYEFFWTFAVKWDWTSSHMRDTDNYWKYQSFKRLILAVPDIRYKSTECLGVDMLANQGIILFVNLALIDQSISFCVLFFSIYLYNVPCAHGLYIPCA